MTRFLGMAILLASFLAGGPAQAFEAYYGDHERGWFWGEDPPPETKQDEKEEEREETPRSGAAGAPFDDPREAIARFREELDIARARAILNPTDENVLDWMEKNRQMLDMSTRFAYAFRRVLLQTPRLDTTLENPVETRAVHAWYDARRDLIEARLRRLAEKQGLFFFFRGSCSFCHRFAPVLKRFAAKYGFRIVAITLDGGRLPEFPDARHDPAAARRFGVSRVPMVMLADPGTRKLKIVTAGFVGPSELERRIYELVEGRPANPAARTLTEVAR